MLLKPQRSPLLTSVGYVVNQAHRVTPLYATEWCSWSTDHSCMLELSLTTPWWYTSSNVLYMRVNVTEYGNTMTKLFDELH